MKWQSALAQMAAAHEDHVLVTVLATSGSAPRDPGAKMVVTKAHVEDTIGGGQLEQMVIDQARSLLDGQQGGQAIQHYPLAAAAEQCCGGSVTVLFEAYVYQLKVAVFGAGYVGREVRGLLEKLDAQCALLDSRDLIPGITPAQYQHCADPLAQLSTLDDTTHILIMTHSHDLDYELVHACLRQQRMSIGLIGSTTKWQRFQARLRRDGVADAQLARVRCPVGVADVKRKEPYAVALSIVTQLLQLEPLVETRSLSWQQVKSSLVLQP